METQARQRETKEPYGTAPVTFSLAGMQCEPTTADFNRGQTKVARNLPENGNDTQNVGVKSPVNC
jgi:hypothetical protein